MSTADPYSRDVLQLAANIPHLERLAAPHGSARKVSRLCGSEVAVDLQLDGERVSAVGLDVSACALGQAAASVLSANIAGADRAELAAGLDALNAMLTGAGEGPQGRFEALRVLAPARSYPARHGSIRLALEAALAAFDDARNNPAAGLS
ncbi:iron-sulfur cluster assembly scaffold protein [Glycocaulis sp.]